MKKFKNIRRFAIGWMLLVMLLIGGLLAQTQQLDAAYKRAIPDRGGVYSEGIVGELSNFNPIYASGSANQAAARLIFSSLYKYDKHGRLKPDLAQSIELSKDGKTYTVTLRDDIYWHDGNKVTSSDVVFTFQAIQNPDARSPLAESWRDITISAKDQKTVQFVLPNIYAPFQHSLVTGIVPEHLLKNMQPAEIRNANFNQAPIGSGPFKFQGLDAEGGQLELSSNADYYDGRPYLNRFVLYTFENQDKLEDSFMRDELTAVADIATAEGRNLDNYQKFGMPLSNAVFSFFNVSRKPLNDPQVRSALASATDRGQIARKLGLEQGLVYSPVFPEHIGYRKNLQQKESVKLANNILDKAGWKKGKDGIRKKGKNKLVISLASQRSNELPEVSSILKQQWERVGAEVDVELSPLEQLRNERIVPHNYQVLLFGISIGADPDVFAYWHSSQATEGGFNFSNYSSQTVDESLEAGRTRLDKQLRAEKYYSFTEQWLKDSPAVPLYRTGINYYQNRKVKGFEAIRLVDPADRFNDVNEWAVNTTETTRILPR